MVFPPRTAVLLSLIIGVPQGYPARGLGPPITGLSGIPQREWRVGKNSAGIQQTCLAGLEPKWHTAGKM